MASDLEQNDMAVAEQTAAQSTPVANSSSNSAPEAGLMIGARLRQAREAKGLSIEQVAERLCFTPQRVRDLEENNFTAISAKAYARGYVQSYAKLLKIDVDEIISAFDSIEFPAEQTKRTVQLVIRRENNGPSAQVRWFGAGIAVVVLALMGFWWHSAHDRTHADTSNNAVSAEIPLQKLPLNSNANI